LRARPDCRRADISIIRWDDESLAEFAERLVDELAQKINEYFNFIDEIHQLRLHDPRYDFDQVERFGMASIPIIRTRRRWAR
jgi:hypothetical protein